MEERQNSQFNSGGWQSSQQNNGSTSGTGGSFGGSGTGGSYGGSSANSGVSWGGYGKGSSGTNQPSGPNGGNGEQDEFERLKRLQQQLNQNNKDDEKKKRKLRFIIWFFLILLLIGLLVVGAYFFIKGTGSVDLGNTIRLSINMDEKLEGGSETNSIKVAKIYPGNSFPVELSVRNANSFYGDSEHLDVAPIFVRFKIELVIDNMSYPNVIVPTVQLNNWVCGQGDQFDGFYYYNHRLESQESIILFSGITFDFANTENWMAGKSASIVITAEAVEGNGNNLGNGEAWGTAPEFWINSMKQQY